MKKFLVSCFFLISAAMEALPSLTPVVLQAENTVDFTVPGATLILLGSERATEFIPISICFQGTDITGPVGFPTTPQFSIGWTATDYNDLITEFVAPPSATNNSSSFSMGIIAPSAYGQAPLIPSSVDVYINVTDPDIGPDTSPYNNIQQIYILGFYLTPIVPGG